MENIGEKIRKIRKENKDTLKSLAKKIDYDWSNLSKVERGKYGATLELVDKIIKVYNADPKYFFGNGFSDAESDLLREDDLEISALKEKYDFQVNGVKASEEEIKEAIRMIRYLRATKEDD